jgi:hypothetical protein
MIPEPENAVTARYQKFRARIICDDLILFCVATSIHLHNQPPSMARKVSVVGPDSRLPTKMSSFNLKAA